MPAFTIKKERKIASGLATTCPLSLPLHENTSFIEATGFFPKWLGRRPDFVMIEAVKSVDDVRHEVLLRNALIAGNQGVVAISPVLDR